MNEDYRFYMVNELTITLQYIALFSIYCVLLWLRADILTHSPKCYFTDTGTDTYMYGKMDRMNPQTL